MIEKVTVDRELYEHLVRHTEKGESIQERLKKKFGFDGDLET